MKLSTEAKIYGFFFAAFAGVVILGAVTYDSTRNMMVTDKSVSHTLEVRDSLNELDLSPLCWPTPGCGEWRDA